MFVMLIIVDTRKLRKTIKKNWPCLTWFLDKILRNRTVQRCAVLFWLSRTLVLFTDYTWDIAFIRWVLFRLAAAFTVSRAWSTVIIQLSVGMYALCEGNDARYSSVEVNLVVSTGDAWFANSRMASEKSLQISNALSFLYSDSPINVDWNVFTMVAMSLAAARASAL